MSGKTTSAKRLLQLGGVSLLLTVVALALTIGQMTAGEKEESQVKLKAAAGSIGKDGRQTITITMDINSGYYAYANPVLNEDLESAKTIVKITSPQKLEDVKINYPEGKKKTTGNLSYMTYEGKVEITAQVKRAAGDTGPLDVTVKYMTCNVKGFCLPPEQVKLQVK